MNKEEIMSILPHRDPFLLVDRVIEIKDENEIIAELDVSPDLYFFKGHFPEFPVMPGVLIIEALAQTGAICVLQKPEYKGKIGFLTGIDNAKFKRKVLPGDKLTLSVTLEKFKFNMGVGRAVASVGDEIAATATIKFAIG